MAEVIQGEQYAQVINVFDQNKQPIDISSWDIDVAYKKATAFVKIPDTGRPTIDGIRFSNDEGSIAYTKSDPGGGTFYIVIPKDFETSELKWDRPDSSACALVEITYNNKRSLESITKQRLWFVFRPSVSFS